MRLHFMAADSPKAARAWNELTKIYKNYDIEEADIIIVLGGDGSMLQALHRVLEYPECKDKKIYGMNRGSIGFLMNKYSSENLEERIQHACCEKVSPLKMTAIDINNVIHSALAVNEVSVFRQSHQASKIRISINGEIRMSELICDGVMLATPAGSTAYNLSARGCILPLDASLLALTPVSPFRPRRWHGAIITDDCDVNFDILEYIKRPVNVAADITEFKSIKSINIKLAKQLSAQLLFDSNSSWNHRVLLEQFKH